MQADTSSNIPSTSKIKSITPKEAKAMTYEELYNALQKTLLLINENSTSRGKMRAENLYNRSYFVIVNEFFYRMFGVPHWQRLDRMFFADMTAHSKAIMGVYHPELEQLVNAK